MGGNETVICYTEVPFKAGLTVQSNLSYVIFQGNIEIWSHTTGGRLIQV
jgi:hypothetical protein